MVGAGERLACTGVVLMIGNTPNADFLRGQVALDAKKYVKWTTVNRAYVSVESVFAAGDVADNYIRHVLSGCLANLDVERYLAA